jgi:molecular chaperone GrpE
MPSSHANEEGAGGASTAEATGLEKRCEELEKRAEELDDRYRRALADRENYRKRADREVARRVEEGRDALALEWLEAMDSVERAMLMAEPDSSLAVGLQAVMEQMQAIDAVDVHVSDAVPDQAVLEVVRPGYAAGERVLRPAQVIVARRGERED